MDNEAWIKALRFRILTNDGQSRVFEVAADSSCGTSVEAYRGWVGALSKAALKNLKIEMSLEATAIRQAAERNSERIAESRRIQVGSLQFNEGCELLGQILGSGRSVCKHSNMFV